MLQSCLKRDDSATSINRHLTILLVSVFLANLLSGCSLLLPESPEVNPPEPLSAEVFEQRVDELVVSLGSSCDTSRLVDNQQRQAQRMTADVRELGSFLRGLNNQIENLADSIPQHLTSESPADNNDDLCNQENFSDPSPTISKTLVGRSEWIGLPPIGTFLKARIDSGASTSSLSAKEIIPFERDGDDWVRFKLALNDDDEVIKEVRDKWFEVPLERRVKVLQASGEDIRPVISLLTTLGPIRQHTEFTLNNRKHLNYPVLLGRRFLLDLALIDVAESYLHERPDYSDDAQ